MRRGWAFLFLLAAAVLTSAALPQPSSAVTVTISPGVLSKSGDIARITWTGVRSPSELDWLGIYSPANSSSDHFIGYIFLSSSPTWLSGSGSLTIPIVNLRSDYQFRVFRWGREELGDSHHHDHDGNPLPLTRHLLGESDLIGFGSIHGPEQIHLAYTGRTDEMRVMFVTGDEDVRYVRYGLREDEMKEMEPALVNTYGRDDMCDSPANDSLGWRNPGFIHDSVMRNLKGGKRYYYQVGSHERGWSGAHSFVPHSVESDETVAFLFGDMGVATPYSTFVRTQEESISTVRWILRDINALGDRPAFVSHIGDISYARGHSWLWDAFFTQIEPISSRVPYHVCVGNHEYDWPLQPWRPDWSTRSYGTDGGGECGVPYSLRFHMPGNSSEPTGTRSPDTRNLYYSFDTGPVHFVYLSTETNFLPGSRQHRFLDRDLAAVDRARTPFIVVQGHRPMYTTSNEYRDAALRERMLGSLEPLFVRENVTLALWGHVHRYERFCPLEKYVCRGGRGPVHVVIGMGGQDWQPSWEPRKDHPDDPIFPQPEMSMFRGGEFGYVRMVASREKLALYYVGNHDGEVHDSVEISASGRVLGGVVNHGGLTADRVGHPWFGRYAMGVALLGLGMVAGFFLGFVKAKRGRDGWDRVVGREVY